MSRHSRKRRRSQVRRRRFPRRPVIDGRLVGPVVVARVLDIGPAGAHIETTKSLRVGASYPFTLELEGVSRRLDARVQWCRLIGTRAAKAGDRMPVYRAGVLWPAQQPPVGPDRPRGAREGD